MQNSIIQNMQQALRAAGRPDRAEHERRYLKSEDDFLGVSVPAGQRIAWDTRRANPELTHDDIVSIANALWAAGMHEEKRLAVQWLHEHCRSLTPDDWPLLEDWVRSAGSWDLIDEISAHLLGSLGERWPALEAHFDTWVGDTNLWVRRAALVSHVVRVRHHTVAPARVRELCDSLMMDGEYFVKKALGWVLRECAVVDPDGTVAFLLPWAARAPRLILREAVRKLDADQQAQVLGTAPRRTA